MTAPDRIRVAQDADGFWTCREAISGSQEYVRADLCAALEAQLAEAERRKQELEREVTGLRNSYFDERRARLSALEATPPAPKVTEAETAIAAASEYCWQRYKGRDPLNLKSPAVFTSHEHQKIAEYIRARLTAAQEEGR